MAWQRTDAAGNRLGVTIYEAGLIRRTGLRRMPGSGGLLDLRAHLGSQRLQHRRGSHADRQLP